MGLLYLRVWLKPVSDGVYVLSLVFLVKVCFYTLNLQRQTNVVDHGGGIEIAFTGGEYNRISDTLFACVFRFKRGIRELKLRKSFLISPKRYSEFGIDLFCSVCVGCKS